MLKLARALTETLRSIRAIWRVQVRARGRDAANNRFDNCRFDQVEWPVDTSRLLVLRHLSLSLTRTRVRQNIAAAGYTPTTSKPIIRAAPTRDLAPSLDSFSGNLENSLIEIFLALN